MNKALATLSLVWTLWAIEGDRLIVVLWKGSSEAECQTLSIRLAFTQGVESRCLGDYDLWRVIGK